MQAIPDPLAELPLESVPAGVLRVVYALWLAKRPPDGYPGRRDFAPSEMVRQLPYINLLDVEGRPPRFHNRLVGTAIVEASGIDMTGRYFDEFAETGDSQARCRTLVETGLPHFFADLPMKWSPRNFTTFSVLGLPLASDGVTIDMILGALTFRKAGYEVSVT